MTLLRTDWKRVEKRHGETRVPVSEGGLAAQGGSGSGKRHLFGIISESSGNRNSQESYG